MAFERSPANASCLNPRHTISSGGSWVLRPRLLTLAALSSAPTKRCHLTGWETTQASMVAEMAFSSTSVRAVVRLPMLPFGRPPPGRLCLAFVEVELELVVTALVEGVGSTTWYPLSWSSCSKTCSCSRCLDLASSILFSSLAFSSAMTMSSSS